jgi:mono/diheme cytochrome c family protein/cyclophilin family peptidyl-prolyl cis-trans isomerase
MNECLKMRATAAMLATGCALALIAAEKSPADGPALAHFQKVVSPILREHCYECHGDGAKKGGLDFEALTAGDRILHNPQLWLKVLRNTRAHIMPPPGEKQPTVAEQRALEQWIKTGGFGLDPGQPDPGRVTVRRLNRTEYRNTLRDLIGVDFDAEAILPADDVGYGFDNIGDVLSLSPLRLEKFIEAAMTSVSRGVPMDTVVMTTKMIQGGDFRTADGAQTGERYSYYQARTTSHTFNVGKAASYRLMVNTKLDGEATPVDPQHAHVVWKCDGKVFLDKDYAWADMDYPSDTFTFQWGPGDHVVTCELTPVYPELKPLRTKMEYRILFLILDGPLEKERWEHHPNFDRFYTRDMPPVNPTERREYAREVLSRFVTRAYRRPVAPETVEQLVEIAEKNYSLPGTTFEKGIAQAITAVLASPRFLFHVENAERPSTGQPFARVDEYTLASRLSYALWSSMPDDELTRLAARGELRKNFQAQVRRMLADPKARAFSENFANQWLQSRSILDIPINSAVVMAAEASPATASTEIASAGVTATNGGARGARAGSGGAGFGGAGFGGRGFGRRSRVPTGMELTRELRVAMKQEVDAYFDYIVREDRSVLELLQSNYTFVNDQLAAVYGLTNITGPELRRVELPPGHVRGGVLTMGGVLTVTSNPTRTSPVKRGKWILENILGSPPAPPPPNVPALEDSQAKAEVKAPTQRELLALHRADPKCASCHARMDPPGLALEGFNAFGRARTNESGHAIDPSGELATGEKFSGVSDLKQALIEKYRLEFYRTLTEKLMTYVLGRGVEYYDVPTVDAIAERLDRDNGKFSTLLFGILDSAPFQQRRLTPNSGRAADHAASPASTPASL